MAETNIRLAKPSDRDQVAQMQAALWPEGYLPPPVWLNFYTDGLSWPLPVFYRFELWVQVCRCTT